MTPIDRSLLTDLLLETLKPNDEDIEEKRFWMVGDHEKPPKAGWQGEVGRSDWIPYMILTATPSQTPTGDIATPGSDVWFGYGVTVVGKSRRGADKASVVAREHLAKLARQQTSDGRTVSQVRVMRYGGVDRLNLDPPLYLVTDQFSIYTTK
jgi:hypothetical protein